MTEPYLRQRKELLRRRMHNAVLDYCSGKICPPYWDLPRELRLPEFCIEPKIRDAPWPPGTGDIIPAQPYQLGVNLQGNQDVHTVHFVSRSDRYFPAAFLTRRRQKLVVGKRTRRATIERRYQRATFIYWPPAPVGRHTILPWGGQTPAQEPL